MEKESSKSHVLNDMSPEELNAVRHAGLDEWNRKYWNSLTGEIELPFIVIQDYAKRHHVPIDQVKIGHGMLYIEE